MINSRFTPLYGCVSLLLCSCSPRVVTEISKNYPLIVSPDQVKVYALEDSVPQKADVIGKVAVLDGGASSFKYDQAVAIAQKETSVAGGNAFAVIDRVKPSFWGSSCDQISGYMLLVNDSLPDPVAYNTVEKVREEIVESRKARRVPANTFSANVGYGGLLSKFYLPEGSSGNPRSGLNWMVGYDWISKRNIGLGVFYSGYKSGYDYASTSINVLQHYIGARLAFKQKIAENWLFEEEVGFGYAGYREKTKSFAYSLDGAAAHISLGTSYMITPHIGVGMNVGYITSNLENQDLVEQNENESTGLFQLFVNGGIRFYF